MTLLPCFRRSALRAAALAVALAAASPAAMAHAVPTAENAAGQEGSQATRGVNIAIVGLGSLWILLMIRRIQSVSALRHAEAGH